MISDEYFSATNIDNVFYTFGPQEIEAKDWAIWYGNVKKFRRIVSTTYDDPENAWANFEINEIMTQWKLDENGIWGVKENLGNFPFPDQRYLGDKRFLEDPRFYVYDYVMPWDYRVTSTGDYELYSLIFREIEFFIHKDKFYFRRWWTGIGSPTGLPDSDMIFSPKKLLYRTEDGDPGFGSSVFVDSLEIIEEFSNKK